MKCLVVDDSALTRRSLVRILGTLGFDDVVEVASGRHALERFDATLDLLVTGWDMPTMTGLDLCAAFATVPTAPACPC